MSLTDVPPTPGSTQIAVWNWCIQFWWAMRKRARAAGAQFWPPTNAVWSSGTVSSITDNGDGTITIGTTIPAPGWDLPTSCSSGATPPSRWVNLTCTNCNAAAINPHYYDLVIEGDEEDPFTCVRGQITGSTGTAVGDAGTITIYATGLTNAVTAKFIGSLTSLVGKPWYILKSGGLWQADRVPEKPNDPEAWAGEAIAPVSILEDTSKAFADYAGKTLTVGGVDRTILDNNGTQLLVAAESVALSGAYQVKDGSTVLESGTIGACYSGIYQTTDSWPAASLAGLELLVFVGGILKRQAITGNAPKWLWYPQVDWSAVGVYSIVAAGSKGQPGRKKWQPFRWHSGDPDVWWTHNADDEITARAFLPKSAFHWDEGDPCTVPGVECADAPHSDPTWGQDFDHYVQIDNLCGFADTYLQPDLYKSFRALQVTLLQLCTSFVPMRSYDGTTAIPNYTPATLFQDAGMDSATSSIYDGGSGVAKFDVSSEYEGLGVYYCVFDAKGNVKVSGVGTVTSGSVLAGGSYSFPADAGLSVVYSPGFKRVLPNRLRYLQRRRCFVPDTASDGLGGAVVVDPPAVATDPETGDLVNETGTWITRPASTALSIYADTGFLVDGPAPEEGDLAVYVGDNFADPGINPSHVYSAAAASSGADLLLPYYDKFFRGKFGPTLWAARLASMSGVATGSTATSITDNAKNWWQDGVNTGVMRTQTLTASSGSATTFVDNSKDVTNPALPWGMWFDPGRFNGDGIYVGFVLRVDRTYSGTDLTIDAADGKKITSAAHAFDANDVGMTVTVTAGAGWATGTYVITAASSGAATLDRSPAPAGTAAHGSWTMTTTYKRPITSITTSAAGIVVNFDALAGFAIVAGDTGAIQEPHTTCNKWIDYKGSLKDPISGDQYTFVVGQNDDNSLFFDQILDADGNVATLTAGRLYAYQINEWPFGVYRFTADGWAPATGNDTVRLGVTVPADFHDAPAENLPGLVTAYGLLHCGDVIQPGLFDGIARCLDKLRCTKAPPHWTSRADPAVAEQNVQSVSSESFCGTVSWDSVGGAAIVVCDPSILAYSFGQAYDIQWSQLTGTTCRGADTDCHYKEESDGAVPGLSMAYAIGYIEDGSHSQSQYNNTFSSSIAYAYPYIDTRSLTPLIPFTVEGYIFCTIDGVDSDPSTTSVDYAPNNQPTADASGASYDKVEFSAAESPAQFRLWASIGSWAGVSGVEKLTGPRVGDAGTPHKPDINLGAVSSVDDGGGYHYGVTSGRTGWTVHDQVALVKWAMD